MQESGLQTGFSGSETVGSEREIGGEVVKKIGVFLAVLGLVRGLYKIIKKTVLIVFKFLW